MIEFNTRKEDPSLTSGFQRRNFKRNCPVEQGSYVTDRTKTGKGVNATESLLLEKDRTALQSSIVCLLNGIFRSMYFQDQPKNTLSFETKHIGN